MGCARTIAKDPSRLRFSKATTAGARTTFPLLSRARPTAIKFVQALAASGVALRMLASMVTFFSAQECLWEPLAPAPFYHLQHRLHRLLLRLVLISPLLHPRPVLPLDRQQLPAPIFRGRCILPLRW